MDAFSGKSHLLNDVSLDVREGEIFALIGRSAPGKATLRKSLAGLVPPDSVTRNRFNGSGDIRLSECPRKR